MQVRQAKELLADEREKFDLLVRQQKTELKNSSAELHSIMHNNKTNVEKLHNEE